MSKQSALGFTSVRRKWIFLLGATAATTGVALHLPMYLGQAKNHYMISGMGWDRWMIVGMVLLIGGFLAALWSLFPRGSFRRDKPVALEVEVPDEGKLSRAHVLLLVTLVFAVAIDAIKPFTFAFILPGVAKEYMLSSPKHPLPGHLSVGLYPLAGIGGTAIGSFVVGWLGDRLGRRAPILASGALFISVSACGGMPAYGYNLAMCFIMGLAVASARLFPARGDDPVEASGSGDSAGRGRGDRARVPSHELARALAHSDDELARAVVHGRPAGARADPAQPFHPGVAALPAAAWTSRRGR